MATIRNIAEMIQAKPASDGDGVKLLRVFGGRGPERFDPFLMLDEFGSQEASDYIGGFPSHPHRGFETVTYMLEGKMEHRDHMGNVGLLGDGDVQWMSAAGGIIHSEMPKQTQGRMRGFQLWVNLPASQKMRPASYSDVKAADIPEYTLDGVTLKAIAGVTMVNHHKVIGYFTEVDTQPVYLDVCLAAGQAITLPADAEHTALVYVFEGSVTIGAGDVSLSSQHLARLDDRGDIVIVNKTQKPARLLVLVAKPLREPIVQYGPFVMNTTAQIEQALADYRSGTLGMAS